MSAREDEYGFAKRRLDAVRVVQLIAVQTAEGEGVADDPVRLHTRYYSFDGALVAETPAILTSALALDWTSPLRNGRKADE